MPPLLGLDDALADLTQRDRLRALALVDGPSRVRTRHDGREILAFCSNDYLGLADHPALATAATDAMQRYGLGAGASRLLSGHLPPHRDLEDALAGLVKLPAALLFSTGYQANLGVVTSLAGPQDLIVSDQANHASIIDGCRLSRAKVVVYGHADADAAHHALQTPGSYRRRLLITESLFSMDGDRAPLAALAQHAQTFAATLVVDEAHALGVLGPDGRGICQQEGVVPDVLVGTLGKAFGAFGGFVAGSTVLRSYLINRSRSFIYTTALPPPIAAAALAAVTITLSPEGDLQRATLARNLAQLGAGLTTMGLAPSSPSSAPGPIVPVTLGSDRRALHASQQLAAHGLFVPAIRPPTVPEGTARLRITLSSAHQPDDVRRLVDALRTTLS